MAKAVAFKPPASIKQKIETPFYDPKIKFPKTYISKWAYKTGAGAVPSLYTVPPGKILVMITATIHQHATNASGGGEGNLESNDPNMAQILQTMTPSAPDAGTLEDAEVTFNFNEGIRFPAGTIISIYRGSNQLISGGFTGYLIDNNAESLYYTD